jgi:hypothetical protein
MRLGGIFHRHTTLIAVVWLILAQSFSPAFAAAFSLQNKAISRVAYLNPQTGRFWTMDSYEGDNSDPLSLHKYLYCQGNPVGLTDLSGHDGDAISLNVNMALMTGIAAFTYAAITESKTHLIGKIAVAAFDEATTDGATLAEATAYALSVYRTSMRDLINQAEDVLKQTGKALRKLKVVPMPMSIIPHVAAHVAAAQV